MALQKFQILIGSLTMTLMLVIIPTRHGLSQDLTIRNISVIDLHTGDFNQRDVRISDGIIRQISPPVKSAILPTDVDGTDKYLIPGMIDAHIHLFQSGGIYTRPDALDLRTYRTYEDERSWLLDQSQDLLRRYLRCGITSVIDVGGPMSNYQIRDKHFKYQEVPSLFVTGPLVSTYQPDAFKIDDPPIVKVNSSEEARELIRKQIPFKPDFIKIWYIALPNQTAESTYEIVKAAVEESHENDLLVAVHATQLNTAKLALKAGADILVHSVDDRKVDDDFIHLLKAREAVYMPSLIVSGNYGKSFTQKLKISEEDFKFTHPIPLGSISDLRHLDEGKILAELRQSEKQYAAFQLVRDSIKKVNLKILQEAGCKIATGTDAGNIGTFHASSYFAEIREMQESGLSNLEIIRACTLGGAEVLKKEQSLGSVAQGKIADLIILNRNPLLDLNALQDIDRVVKNGRLLDPDTIVRETPENLVQQQLNGYNARNIEAFLAPYSDSIQLFDFKQTEPWAKGKDQMRVIYQNMFDRTPNLHCQLVNRIIQGNTIIDRERVTGFADNDPIEASAIYEIEQGKIARVYFVR